MTKETYFPQPSVQNATAHFSMVPSADIQRSRFDRSHGHKTTFDAGKLIPIYCDEVLPGDTFHMKTTGFVRLATPLKPLMDNIYVDLHYFFVPYRLVWTNWKFFMGERANPSDDPTTKVIPTIPIDLNALTGNDLCCYLAAAPRVPSGGTVSISALPFRAYRLIYNEWYRDQNLQTSISVSTGDGPDSTGDATGAGSFAARNKRHDYFTSCLPWPQKGTAVSIPLGTRATVLGIGVNGAAVTTAGSTFTQSDGTTWTQGPAQANSDWLGNGVGSVAVRQSGTSLGRPDVYADLTNASTITINALRQAFQIQKLLERDARGGTRYIELILAHFGVKSSDARLQRPEYLGGGTTRININPVAATAYTTQNIVGSLAATGTGVLNGGFTKSFEEHGVIIGMVSARCDMTYQNGIDRMWWRQTRYDFYWPALAHIGEQAVYDKEIFVNSTTATNNTIFGYQERYAEYRYKPSRITGQFNSNVSTPLDSWHLGLDFATLPVLNATFMNEAPPIDRVVAVPSEPDFLADFWFDLQCERPMPVYSVPGLIDHF